MTKRLSLIAFLFISLFSSCSDDSGPYQCKDCADAPEANAANDTNGKGIYKGVLIGSTGNIKFDIANNGTAITAVLEIDGKTVLLTATGSYDASTGFTGTFTGTMEAGAVSIQFTVTNTGAFTVGTVTIPGHPSVIFRIIKERSTKLVEAFEGTFKGGDNGTFNLVMIRNNDGVGEWGVIARSDSDKIFTGEVQSNQLIGGAAGVVIVGEVGGDNVSGSWEYVINGVSAAHGTWVGKRTL